MKISKNHWLTSHLFLGLMILISLSTPILATLFSYPWLKFWPFEGAFLQSKLYLSLRGSRYLLAYLTGSGLALCGVSFQSLLKNPLADPYILGVSGGAALGYVMAIVLGFSYLFYPLFALGFALASLFIIYHLALEKKSLNTYTLLLTGIVFNALSFALIVLLNTMAPLQGAQQILFLLMGSIESLEFSKLIFILIFNLTLSVTLMIKANTLNAMSLGETFAYHLGVNIEKEKMIIFVITSWLVGISVSFCGLIGFVGLFVPHLMRLVVGADHRKLLPASFFFGGAFLVAAEFLASHLFISESFFTKLPVGVITALIGAPVFFILLKRESRS